MGGKYFVDFYRGEKHICRVYEFSRHEDDIRIGDTVEASLGYPVIKMGLLPRENSKKLEIFLMRMEKKRLKRRWKELERQKLEMELFPTTDPFQLEDPSYEDVGQYDGDDENPYELFEYDPTEEELLESIQGPALRIGKVMYVGSNGPSYTIDFGGAIMTFPYAQLLGPIVSVDEHEIPPLDDPWPKWFPSPDALFDRRTPVLEMR